jgi:hypothetical protein
MDRETIEERLEKAKQRAQKWQGEHRRLEGIKRGETRRRDTRRKIWAGGWLLNVIKEDAGLREKFAAHLRTTKFRKGEAELFADLIGVSLDRADARAGAVCPRTPEDTVPR